MLKIIKFPQFENNLKELKLMKDYHYSDIIIFGFVFLGSDEKVPYIMRERSISYKFWPKKTKKALFLNETT